MGFRWFVHQLARDIGLVGRVSNQPDGTVLVTAEGDRTGLEELVDGLNQGPRHAMVVSVDLQWSTPRNRWRRFAIDRG